MFNICEKRGCRVNNRIRMSGAAALLTALIFFASISLSYAEVKDSLKEKAVVDEEWEKQADLNKDGIVDRVEINRWRNRGRDKDNNPPGPAGGEGTNWENPAGPVGGPGASPEGNTENKAAVDKRWEKRADANKDGVVDEVEINQWKNRPRGDRDNNPPGPKGGEGTNWENPAGPAGGPGASPDRRAGVNPPGPRGGPGAGPKWDKDNNPPGPKGGEGTNWENPAGPVGGPGASPNTGNVKAKSVVDKKWEAKADKNKDGVVGRVEANKMKATKAVAKPKASKGNVKK
jgi:hypothetical protein